MVNVAYVPTLDDDGVAVVAGPGALDISGSDVLEDDYGV